MSYGIQKNFNGNADLHGNRNYLDGIFQQRIYETKQTDVVI